MVALADRHGNQLADFRVEPGGRAGRRAIQHERLAGHVRAEPLHEAVELRGLERAIAVIDQHRALFGIVAHRVAIVDVDHRVELDRHALGGDHVGEPADRELAQFHHALREREMFGKPVEQRDFFKRVEQVGRNLGHLPLELAGVLLGRSFVGEQLAHLQGGLRMPRHARFGPIGIMRRRQAERGGCGRDLRIVANALRYKHRHGQKRHVGRLDRQRNRQHHDRRHFIHDLRPSAPGDFFQEGQPGREVAGHSVGRLLQHVASRGIDDSERLIERAFERRERALGFCSQRWSVPVVARQTDRRRRKFASRGDLVWIDGGHVEDVSTDFVGVKMPVAKPRLEGLGDETPTDRPLCKDTPLVRTARRAGAMIAGLSRISDDWGGWNARAG